MASWLYIGLGAIALVVLVVTWTHRDQSISLGSSRDRRKPPREINALALGGIILMLLALLAGVVWVIDRAIVTDRKQIELAVREMADGIKSHDTERVFRQVSDSYQGPPRGNKSSFKEYARPYIERTDVTDAIVWDFSWPDDPPPAPGTLRTMFSAKVKGGIMAGRDEVYYIIDATFCQDPDKQWRLRKFLLRNPAAPMDILPIPH